jgi:hypothetical protein
VRSSTPPATRPAPNLNVYDSRFYQDTYIAGIIAGHMTKTGTLGYVGSVPIPEVLRNINAYTLGAQSVPEGQDQGGVDQQLVRPAQGDRGRAGAAQRRRRRAAAKHRLARRHPGRRQGRQAGLRLGLRHERVRRQGPPGLVHRRLEPLLQEGRQGRAGRHLEVRTRGVGLQGRHHQRDQDRRQRARGREEEDRRGQGRLQGRHLRPVQGPDRRQSW